MKLRTTNEAGTYVFFCPGCQEMHQVWTQPNPAAPGRACWGFNGSMERPTFTPSLLIRSGHYVPGEAERIAAGKTSCWCEYQKNHPEITDAPKCTVCHSFITDGKIQYLGDCTHDLKNQTVELPEQEDKTF